MWYSPTVSYVAGSALLLSSFYVYRTFVRHTLPEPPPSTPPRSRSGPTPLMLKPAFGAMALTHACFGLNQIFDAAARTAHSAALYQVV